MPKGVEVRVLFRAPNWESLLQLQEAFFFGEASLQLCSTWVRRWRASARKHRKYKAAMKLAVPAPPLKNGDKRTCRAPARSGDRFFESPAKALVFVDREGKSQLQCLTAESTRNPARQSGVMPPAPAPIPRRHAGRIAPLTDSLGAR